MELTITKSARQYGYLIWNHKSEADIVSLIGKRDVVNVIFNGFHLGPKHIDWKYHRISLGYKLTRAMSGEHNRFLVDCVDDVLEVTSFHE